MANITVIPATKALHSKMPVNARSRRKVAGYARVSTDSEEQLTSYEAQVDYYTKYIRSNPDWEFVDVYTDEGISATNTRHRDGFNRMIADALAGRIDLIVTKSVSRFARNTVDSLTAVRKLKEHGTEVYFEKEDIYTFDSKGELLITIMSSLAQEESRSISENVTWGQRKRFADGKVSLPYKFLPRLSQGVGRLAGDRAGGGGDRPGDLQAVHSGQNSELDCYAPYRQGHPHASRQGKVADQHNREHPDERKIQGLGGPAEEIHRGFPFQKDEGQRGRGAAVHCRPEPSGHYRSGPMAEGAG